MPINNLAHMKPGLKLPATTQVMFRKSLNLEASTRRVVRALCKALFFAHLQSRVKICRQTYGITRLDGF